MTTPASTGPDGDDDTYDLIDDALTRLAEPARRLAGR